MKRLTEDYKDRKKGQTLNTLASNLLFINKTKKSAVAVECEEERILVVTG